MTKRAPGRFLAVVLAAAAFGQAAIAAGPAGSFPVRNAHYGAPPSGPVQGVAQAFAPGDPLVDAHGDPAVIPAQYCPPGGGGYGYGDPTYNAFGNGGYVVDQVGPHYFDASVEYLAYKRDSVFDGDVDFTSFGFQSDSTVTDREIVLSSSDLGSELESGFRVTGRYDIGPLAIVEFGYSGVFDMASAASVTDDTASAVTGLGALFSPFTNFGEGFGPPAAVDPIEGGFDPTNLEDFEETDRASMHSVSYTSDLQTAEISYRRYWVGYSPRISGTLLAGFRYTKLKESFRFFSQGVDFAPGSNSGNTPVNTPNGSAAGQFNQNIVGDNDLAGFQMGGDIWVGVIQGLRFGAEGKIGLYNNSYDLTSVITTSDGTPTELLSASNDQAAFIGEGRLMMVADVLPSLSFKAGYEVLWLNSVALVGKNFNGGDPYGNANTPARVSTVLDQGNALFHGWTTGFEYIW